MKKVSGSVRYIKKIFPAAWFMLMAGVALGVIFEEGANRHLGLLVIPAFMALVGYLIFRGLIWPLADEAHDGGDFLLLRRGELEQRVNFDDILTIHYAFFTNPERVEMTVRQPGPLGTYLVFAVPIRWKFWVRDAEILELLERIERHRARHQPDKKR